MIGSLAVVLSFPSTPSWLLRLWRILSLSIDLAYKLNDGATCFSPASQSQQCGIPLNTRPMFSCLISWRLSMPVWRRVVKEAKIPSVKKTLLLFCSPFLVLPNRRAKLPVTFSFGGPACVGGSLTCRKSFEVPSEISKWPIKSGIFYKSQPLRDLTRDVSGSKW